MPAAQTRPALKAILWDNDGVLIDSEPLFYEVNRQLFAEHGISLGVQHYVRWFLDSDRGAWHLLRQKHYSDTEIAALRQQRDARYSALLRRGQAPLRAQIPPLLQALRAHPARLTMGIVTGAWAEHFQLLHAKTGILPYFDFVVTREDYAHAKPAPDAYRAGLLRSGCDNAECIAIEDSLRGAKAAQAAQIRCLVLRTGLSAGCRFGSEFEQLDSVAELSRALSPLLPRSTIC